MAKTPSRSSAPKPAKTTTTSSAPARPATPSPARPNVAAVSAADFRRAEAKASNTAPATAAPARVTPAKPPKPTTPAGQGMVWRYDSKTNKWVRKKAPAPSGGGGPSFETSGLPSLDLSNISLTGPIAIPEPAPAAPAVDAAAEAARIAREAQAEQLRRAGLGATAAGAAAGLTRDELAAISAAEQEANASLAQTLREAASGRRESFTTTRAEQNRLAYQNALQRQRAQAEMAAQGFISPGGVGSYQQMVLGRQGAEALSEQERRLAAAQAAFRAMEEEARIRRDAETARLLARINPVAAFTQGVS